MEKSVLTYAGDVSDIAHIGELANYTHDSFTAAASTQHNNAVDNLKTSTNRRVG